ncbi:MAG: hypothetical protein H0T62_11025 [Parachlamydiaceae bacterium]|nr:hypothetical protein [Parachlamydiaceae bacterium]
MEISKEDLLLAAQNTTLEPQQIESLWQVLESQNSPLTEKTSSSTSEFNAAKVTYYVGAFIALFSLPLFLSHLWERVGYEGSLAIFAAYATAFAFFGWKLTKKNEKIAGGVLWTLFLCMIPFMVYCAQQLLGLWPTSSEFIDIFDQSKSTSGNAIVIELVTLATGLIVLKYNRLPLLLFPISLAIFFLFSDITIWFFKENPLDAMHLYKWSSLASGIFLILLGMLFQWREVVAPFWAYFFGLIALESALMLLLYKSEVERLIFYFINLFLLFLSLGLRSRVFAILVAGVLFSSFAGLLYFNEPTLITTKASLILIGILIVIFGLLSKRQGFLPAHWFYLLGLIAFEIGISFLWNGSELNRFAFALINFFLIFLSLFFDSHLFSLFGGVAIFAYLSYLASTVFSGSILFPFALIAIGALIFSFGIIYSRYYSQWRLLLLNWLPKI